MPGLARIRNSSQSAGEWKWRLFNASLGEYSPVFCFLEVFLNVHAPGSLNIRGKP